MPETATIAAFRFGYGLPLPTAAPTDPDAMLMALAAPDAMAQRFPVANTAAAQAVAVEVRAFAKEMLLLEGEPRAELRKAGAALSRGMAMDGARAAIARALDNPDGLRERLVQFWSHHFTVVGKGLPYLSLPSAMVEDAIRPNLTAPFATMLTAVITHPAMLIYLNQDSSFGPASRAGKRRKLGLNENLARELMELHTLGVGAAYSQSDVRELAELLTGLGFSAQDGFAFYPARAEPGAETVLGTSYGGAGVPDLAPIHAVLADLAVRPETAHHLARKLAVHFLADLPDPAAVDAIAQAWAASGGDLAAVTAALLNAPGAWAPPGAKVRQPYDFVVAGLRALGVTGDGVVAMEPPMFRRRILMPMGAMGQPWQQAPGPDGWPELAGDWITPQGLGARLRWTMDAPAQLVKPLPDPRDFVATALGDAASPLLVTAAGRAETQREGVGLVLASPEFNRR